MDSAVLLNTRNTFPGKNIYLNKKNNLVVLAKESSNGMSFEQFILSCIRQLVACSLKIVCPQGYKIKLDLLASELQCFPSCAPVVRKSCSFRLVELI